MTMIPQPTRPADPLFDWTDKAPHFRGARVVFHAFYVAGRRFKIAGLKDAAALLDDPIFAKEFVEADRAPYGLELWPVAKVLAEHILKGEPGDGRPVLDLGCGLGLTSMAATLCGWRVTAADHDPAALLFAEYNTKNNGIGVEAFELFDWHFPPADRKFARVFGADILYQRSDQLPILRTLSAVLAPDGQALLADPHRLSVDGFQDRAREHGWRIEGLAGTAPNSQGRMIKGRIFVLRRA